MSSVWLLLVLPLTALATAGFRLPDTVRPVQYRLDLTIIPDQPTFNGTAEIDVSLAEPASRIWLNGKDLTIKYATVSAGGVTQKAAVSVEDGEFLGLTVGNTLAAGSAVLNIEYAAKLDEKLSVGAYRRSDGRNWYVFTTFTAIEARRAFPCFDQPEFKTPWRVVIHARQGDIAVANSREVSRKVESSGLTRFEFGETRPLPSEVVAFAVGPFDIVEDGKAGRNGIPVRIVAPQGRGGEATDALGATREILPRLEDYTGIPYPWDKLDHIALLDMPFGAVENPGLITYRDRSLLAREGRATGEHRQALRGVMAHELAHQWFGNLVTQRWWNDVWLSEGFATWLGGRTADLDLPDFQRGIAAAEGRARIMAVDNRAVRVEMHSRKEMQDVYSRIVYNKGAAVLAMVEHWMGPAPFQQGLRRYLREHAGGSATTADLIMALTAESGMDVAPVFASYLDQPGFPRVTARLDCAAKRIIVEQESKLKWNTPVCLSKCVVISGARADLPVESCPAWIWPNAAGTGYFRSSTPSLKELMRDWTELSVPERISVVNDVELLSPAEQVAVLPQMVRDRDAHVAAAAARAAARLSVRPGADVEAIRKMLR